MRLWSLHPCHLDTRGLGGLWREGLLAQKILLGELPRCPYRNHPQLKRFVVGRIGRYLYEVWQEGRKREYKYNAGLIRTPINAGSIQRIPVTLGQVEFEARLLRDKLHARGQRWRGGETVRVNPVFEVVNGDQVEPWERSGRD